MLSVLRTKLAPAIAWSSWALLSMTAVAPGLLALLYDMLGLRGHGRPAPLLALVTAIAAYALAVGAMLLPLYLLGRRPYAWRTWLGLQGRLRWAYMPDMLGAYLGYLVVSLGALLLVSLIPGIGLDQTQDVGFQGLKSPFDYAVAALTLAVVAPVCEEILFRGLLYGRLRQYLGWWQAAVATSLAFGLVHQQLNVGIDVAVLSFFLCALRERTGSIWAGVVVHGLKNAVAFVLVFILPATS